MKKIWFLQPIEKNIQNYHMEHDVFSLMNSSVISKLIIHLMSLYFLQKF
jgi:hypothetical protein